MNRKLKIMVKLLLPVRHYMWKSGLGKGQGKSEHLPLTSPKSPLTHVALTVLSGANSAGSESDETDGSAITSCASRDN